MQTPIDDKITQVRITSAKSSWTFAACDLFNATGYALLAGLAYKIGAGYPTLLGLQSHPTSFLNICIGLFSLGACLKLYSCYRHVQLARTLSSEQLTP